MTNTIHLGHESRLLFLAGSRVMTFHNQLYGEYTRKSRSKFARRLSTAEFLEQWVHPGSTRSTLHRRELRLCGQRSKKPSSQFGRAKWPPKLATVQNPPQNWRPSTTEISHSTPVCLPFNACTPFGRYMNHRVLIFGSCTIHSNDMQNMN